MIDDDCEYVLLVFAQRFTNGFCLAKTYLPISMSLYQDQDSIKKKTKTKIGSSKSSVKRRVVLSHLSSLIQTIKTNKSTMDHHQQMNHILYVGLIGGVSSGLVGGVQCKQQQKKHQHHESSMMNYYSSYDVLNGRGQGVQRHPGNVNYRILVFVNKVSTVGHVVSSFVCVGARNTC